MNNNELHCKQIAEDLATIANGNMYKCPECGELIDINDLADQEHFECKCGYKCLVEELEPLDFGKYFEDNLFDIEYAVDAQKKYKSAAACVAFGGPTIYIDTKTCAVRLWWWQDYAEYPLDEYTVDAIDEFFEELYNC